MINQYNSSESNYYTSNKSNYVNYSSNLSFGENFLPKISNNNNNSSYYSGTSGCTFTTIKG